jgi:light-regulated signal transduction histidine kinase (bacteriophytochrome)
LRTVLEPVVAGDRDVEGAEISCTLPDRTQIVLSVSVRRVPEEQDLHKMILVELRDVTQERNAERRIRELNEALQKNGTDLDLMNKELESFSHSVSHDLRMPLRLINKMAHVLLHDHGANLPGGAIEIINMIIDGTQEMGRLMEVLLTFSRVIRDPIKKRRVELQRLAREAIEELRDEQGGRVVEFVIEELPPCHVDRALFKQVFLNLLANALKFTRPREKAEIRIGCMETVGETVYFVRDNGVGFDMGKSDSLFVAFHRLHKPSEFEGSGVGLALVRRIVERHNGRIWGESEIDKGATFYFTLGE